MAILSENAPRRSEAGAARRHLVVALGLAGLVGCVLVRAFETKPAGLGFSHRIHVADEGMDCSDCHATVESSDEPGMPTRAMCLLCHKEIDEGKPLEKRIDALFEGEKLRAAPRSELADEVIFSHQLHAGDGQECSNCHGDLAKSERIDASVVVSMDDCMACHRSLRIANDCSTCHQELREDVAPSNHDANWKRIHGGVFRAGTGQVAARCTLCHSESSCTACHRDERPESHDVFWDRRGHAVQARMDRQRCATCHEPDACDRCHSEVEPLSHRASWSSPQNNHCLGCHFGFADQGCFTCHQGTPSHALAPPKPPDHSSGMNCLQCHGVTQPLPHATKGDDCNLCHM